MPVPNLEIYQYSPPDGTWESIPGHEGMVVADYWESIFNPDSVCWWAVGWQTGEIVYYAWEQENACSGMVMVPGVVGNLPGPPGPPGPNSLLRPWTIDPSACLYTQGVQAANFATAARIVNAGTWPISKLGIIVAAISAGSNISLAVYHDNGSDAPGVLFGITGLVPVPPANAVALIPLTSPITVTQGDWIAYTSDATGTYVTGIARNQMDPPWRIVGWDVGAGLVYASNPTALAEPQNMYAVWGEP